MAAVAGTAAAGSDGRTRLKVIGVALALRGITAAVQFTTGATFELSLRLGIGGIAASLRDPRP